MKYSFNFNPLSSQNYFPSVDLESESIEDVPNRSVLSYVFGFYNSENEYDSILVIFSIMAIIPVIGGIFSLFSSVEKGPVEFIHHPEVNDAEAVACGFLVFLRIILSCLGLGLLFFTGSYLYFGLLH